MGDQVAYGKIILKSRLQKYVVIMWVGLISFSNGSVMEFCENGNERLRSLKGGDILAFRSDCTVPKTKLLVWNWYLCSSLELMWDVCAQQRHYKLPVLINHAAITIWSVPGKMNFALDYLITRCRSWKKI